MTPFNTARKAMLQLLANFPAPQEGLGFLTPSAPSPTRLLLLDIDSYLESLPEQTITQRDEALIAAQQVVKESRLLLKIAELNAQIAELRCIDDARVAYHAGTDEINVTMFAPHLHTIPDGLRLDPEKAQLSYSQFRNAGWSDQDLIKVELLIGCVPL